jgi:hypothetical protein
MRDQPKNLVDLNGRTNDARIGWKQKSHACVWRA